MKEEKLLNEFESYCSQLIERYKIMSPYFGNGSLADRLRSKIKNIRTISVNINNDVFINETNKKAKELICKYDGDKQVLSKKIQQITIKYLEEFIY